jgi:hypothetical protein
MVESTEIQLTDRELLVAQKAAELAVKHMTDTFYKEVGRSFINKFFIVVGAAVVAYAAGRGWWKIGG